MSLKGRLVIVIVIVIVDVDGSLSNSDKRHIIKFNGCVNLNG